MQRQTSSLPVTAVFLLLAALAACGRVQTAPSPNATSAQGARPERAVRRDIPLTNTIRRAFAAGTRDSTGRPGRNYWQQWTEYTIAAKLDVPSSTITGKETVVLHNNSDSTLQMIRLRLDQNIQTPGVWQAGTNPGMEFTKGMQVTAMRINGQAVNLHPQVMNPVAPRPTAYGLMVTNGWVVLPNPVPAKSTVTLEVEWNFEVPKEYSALKMGRLADSVYQVAQWYPRIAVFDDLRGWDGEAYRAAEFYNNFGRWDVSLDVPAGWIVGATGVLQNPEEVLSPTTRERLSHVLESDSQRTIVGAADFGSGPGKATATGDRLVWRFVADTAGDFAWAASRSYVWDASRATIPGRDQVPINILYQPGDTSFRQVGARVRHALEYYSRLWMPYSFPVLTVADGVELGMEYPMFIMSDLGAADHETGHQWWPMTVGTNETWYGWMDEGFTSYMHGLSTADRLGRPAVLDSKGQSYGRISGREYESPMMWPTNYQAGLSMFTTYTKAPQMLSMLGGIVGDSAVQRAMSEYARTWRFKHPSPWDYMFFMSRALGRDLGWFWYYWLFTTDAVNGSIASVTTSGSRTVVMVRQDGEMPSPVVLKVQFAPRGPTVRPMPNSRMVDSVTAIVTYPVDVWFGGSRSFPATLNFGGRAITRITLDPFGRFPDRDPTDNDWPRVP